MPCQLGRTLIGGGELSPLGSIGSSTITGLVFHQAVDDHGVHIMGIILLAAGTASFFLVVADRALRPQRD